MRYSSSAARPQSPAGSTNSTVRRSRTTGSPTRCVAAEKAGSRLPMVSTPLIAPRLRTFSLSCVINDVILTEGSKKPSVSPALVEELGVAAVVVAAQEGAVADLLEAVLLEDAPHPVVVDQG